MPEFEGRPADIDVIAKLALTNYGHFTSMLVDRLRVRGLRLHLERLSRDARLVFGAELDLDHVRYLVRHALADQDGPIVARVTVFDPDVELGHPANATEPRVLVTTRPSPQAPAPPLRLQSVVYCRDMPEVKHVGLFGSLRHRRAAQVNGYGDALFTDAHSHVSEAATWNVGFFDGDRLIWPKADILAGTTQSLIQQMHDGAEVTAPVSLHQVSEMAAAFGTNAAVGVRAIGAIDSTSWSGDHPIIARLRSDYEAVEPELL